jgi:hypothetical protein
VSPALESKPSDTTTPAASSRKANYVSLPIGFVGIAVGCLLAWRAALQTGLSGDVFWHWAAGTWMLDHHRVMTTDVFSYTVRGHSWITPEWGYSLVLAESVRAIGSAAFWLLSAGLATLTVIAVAVLCRLAGAGWTWTGLLCIETGAAVTLVLDDRPQMVSYFFLALLLVLLTVGRRRRGVLISVPILFVVWANMHGSYLLGLLLLGLEAVATFAPRRMGRLVVVDPLSRRDALVLVIASFLATFVNPFGPDVYRSALGITFNPTIRSLVTEWQSPNFHDPSILAVVVVPLFATIAFLIFSKSQVPAVELVLAGFLLVSTLDAVRFLPYFAIVWCALAARCSPLPEEQIRPNVLVWPLLAVLGFSFLGGHRVPAGQPAGNVPVQAVAYLKTHPGRVFSTYLWNDYLDWKGIPVFVDGRTELYTGTPILTQYLDLDTLAIDPDPILRSYGVTYVLWPPGSALSQYLEHDSNWRIVRRSSLSIVFRYAGSHQGAGAS